MVRTKHRLHSLNPKACTLCPLQMYHASRESFLYLRDFYLGEIHPEDRAIVPQVIAWVGCAGRVVGRVARVERSPVPDAC
jgi:hypothetical protein